MPIYRQIMDQIRYQIASGILKPGDRMPSVRELAVDLAVNQNTVLKVYNELCRDQVLEVVRGDGTYVARAAERLSAAQRRRIMGELIRPVTAQAVQLNLGLGPLIEIVRAEYEALERRRRAEEAGTSEREA